MKANTDRLYRDIEFLTSLDPPRNYRNLASLNRAADYILQAFVEQDLQTEEQSWEVGGQTYRNVIAAYRPELPRRLIAGAHYDVYGDLPGADTNASGVAGLLESARLIAQQQPELDYGIDLVAYSLEEPPFFGNSEMGSHVHARSLFAEGVSVLGMLCFEMIGYFSGEPGSQQFPDPKLVAQYPDTGNFIIVVGIEKYAAFTRQVFEQMKAVADIDVQMILFPEPHSLAGMSDQRSYWAFDYPALMINDTSFLRNPHYHLPTDTIDTLDFPKMASVVSATVQAMLNLHKGEEA